jgi:hypothetical protein
MVSVALTMTALSARLFIDDLIFIENSFGAQNLGTEFSRFCFFNRTALASPRPL